MFSTPGILVSRNVCPILDSAIRHNTLRIEIDFQTPDESQSGPARILTISNDTSHRNLTIGQAGSDLVIRIRTNETDLNGLPQRVIPDLVHAGRPVQLVVSIDQESLEVTANAKPVLTADLPSNPIACWNPTFHTALGNEMTGDRPWLGEITSLNLSAGETTIEPLREREMIAPPGYWFGFNPQLDLPWMPDRESWSVPDAVLNLIGFIPLGYLLAGAMRGQTSIFPAIAICSVLSLSVESMQLLFGGRFPDLSDWILNSGGSTIGVFGWHRQNISE